MNSSNPGSITVIYDRMKTGDDDAALELWKRFAEQLSQRANRRLQGRRAHNVVGADDAVVDVFDTVFRRAREGRFPRIDSRDDLFRVLLTITDRKCSNINRHFETQQRGGKESFAQPINLDSEQVDPLDLVRDSHKLEPDASAMVTETFDELMRLLEDHDKIRLAEIAEMRMAGWLNKEIAKKIDRSEKVVERRLKLIREIWKDWAPS